jgi:hypothetical protein
MTKPAPIVLVAICVVAACTVAFTIADHFEKKKKRAAATAVAKNDSTLFVRKNPPHGQPGHRHDLPDGAPLPVKNTTSSTISATNTNNASLSSLTGQPDSIASRSVAVNPPHGQPGHSCAIAVGAPLSSAPADAKVSTEPALTDTRQGMNPAHGQPGHRCDIAVGAPLNSPPAKTNTTPTTAATGNTKSSVAPGMNPPHGQPGHRCDIAVGAPLNSPKATQPSTTQAATITNSTKPAVPNYSFTPMQDSTRPAAPQFEYDSTGAPLNPPHGKPGHDCAVPVGKPLTAKK